jgi:hypothetical protein
VPGTRPRDRPSPLEVLDGTAFVLAGAAATWLALLILGEGLVLDWRLLLLVPFWVIAAYLALPRVHRVLTYLYLPDYFIGRARTSDGLLGDPVNLALRGDEQQVHRVMERAGWVKAEEVTLASSARIVATTLRRVSYPAAPVSPLHLFGRPQDFAYQQEVAGNPAQRHHVRFWHCPTGWMLPGGEAVDWLAAGSYDRTVGLSLFTFQVTHRIAQDIDVERDFIVGGVTATSPEVTEHRLVNFSTGYHSHNGGGDRIETDGDLPVLELDRVDAPARAPAPLLPPLLRAPPPTVFGAGVAAGRGLLALAVAAGLALSGGASRFVVSGAAAPTVTATALGFAAVGLLDLWLARAVVRGSTWARLLLLLDSSVLILDAASSDLSGGPRPTLGNGLPTVTLSILVMLALSSTRAREYARAHSPGSRARAGRTQPSPGG